MRLRNMILMILIVLLVVRISAGATKWCRCSWKIGKKTGTTSGWRYWGWFILCWWINPRCPGKCMQTVKSVLRHPESTYAGKEEVCRLHGPTTSRGVGVYVGTSVTKCKGLRYEQIVAPGTICCYRKCRYLRLMYRQKNHQHAIGITLRDPYIKPYYKCGKKHTTFCEADCRKSLRASKFGSTSVNWFSGRRVCNVLKKKIAYPGVRIEVDYDIGDNSDHFYVVPGGNVCCGCVCKLRAIYKGSSVNIPVTLLQSAQARYFSCVRQASQCRDYCREVIGKVLNKDKRKLTSLGVGAATKACTLINQSKNGSPGVVLYSMYDVGAGPVSDKLGDTCCAKIPKQWQKVANLPPVIANVNC